jgi:tetratricopeptide (TPR) repeat protein
LTDTTAQQVVQQVEALLERRRTGQARALLKPALATNPQHTGLLLQSAWADYLDDEYDDALATVRQVLVSEPKNDWARLLYFELLLQKGDSAEAERVIIELLRENPEHAHYYGRYAQLMLRTLNVEKSRQLALEGLKYDPDSVECLSAQVVCDFIERPGNSASQALQQLLVRHPQSAQTLLLIVIALQQRGDRTEALSIARELLRAQPDNEELVDLVKQLRLVTHWSMLPLWPVLRFGWAGSVGIWLIAVIGLSAMRRSDPALAGTVGIAVLVYVAYSWIWPPLLRRLMRA